MRKLLVAQGLVLSVMSVACTKKSSASLVPPFPQKTQKTDETVSPPSGTGTTPSTEGTTSGETQSSGESNPANSTGVSGETPSVTTSSVTSPSTSSSTSPMSGTGETTTSGGTTVTHPSTGDNGTKPVSYLSLGQAVFGKWNLKEKFCSTDDSVLPTALEQENAALRSGTFWQSYEFGESKSTVAIKGESIKPLSYTLTNTVEGSTATANIKIAVQQGFDANRTQDSFYNLKLVQGGTFVLELDGVQSDSGCPGNRVASVYHKVSQ